MLNGVDFYSEDLKEENRSQKFFCPNCPSKLIPVIPKKEIIDHFRHKDGHAHGEPETKEHCYGKNLIRKVAMNLGFEATTEYRIGDHVTDVFVKSPVPLAIEFQCSKCNSEEIMKRTSTYLKEGVVTLWILGNSFLEKQIVSERNCLIESIIEEKQRCLLYISKDEKFRIKKEKPNATWDYRKKPSFNYDEYWIQVHIEALAKGNPVKYWTYIKSSPRTVEWENLFRRPKRSND